jgi:hypothetical protein
MSISIIIPVYNEEKCIERCVRETRDAFLDADHEIIIVNDGSTDGSRRIIAGLANGDHQIRCVDYSANRGYSHAIRQGILLAGKDYTSYLDADLQYPPSELRRMYDFASTERREFVLGKPTRKYYNPYRQLLTYGYNFLVSRLLHLPVSDANSLKLIKTEILKKLPLKGELGAIEIEILVGIANQSPTIHCFPIRVQRRLAGKSKSGLKLIGPTLKSIMELRRVRRRDPAAGR